MDDAPPPAKEACCVCAVVFTVIVSFVSMSHQVYSNLAIVYDHVSPLVVGQIRGSCQKPLISKWNETCQLGYEGSKYKTMFKSWGLPATACKQVNATRVACKFNCDDILAGTAVSTECDRYKKLGNKYCQRQAAGGLFVHSYEHCDVTHTYEELLELFQQARKNVCKADRLERDAKARCQFLLPFFVEVQHLIKAFGTALFMLNALRFSRDLLQKSTFVRKMVLRAGLQWYAIVVNMIVILHCFVTLEETCEPKDEADTDWLCAPSYDVWSTIARMYNSVWAKRLGQLPISRGAYKCMKVSFSVGAAFTAAGLIGGIVDLFPRFIDKLDTKAFFLYEDMPQKKVRSNLFFCIYCALWFYLPRVLRLFMSIFMNDVLNQGVLNLLEGGQILKANLLLIVQSDPPSLVVMTVSRLAKSNPLDIFQLEILCMLPAYLATARLLQYIGMWYPGAWISLPKFGRQEWNGEETPMPSDYQELKDFVHEEMRTVEADARNP